jgi:hypothetical protein
VDGALKLDNCVAYNIFKCQQYSIPYGLYFFSQAINKQEGIEVKEKFHYETIAEYPNGGKDVKKIVDVEEVKAKDAWDEEIPIQKYILYTAEELEAKLNEIKNAKIAKSKT